MLFVTSVDEDFFALHQRRTAASSALLAIIRPDYYVALILYNTLDDWDTHLSYY